MMKRMWPLPIARLAEESNEKARKRRLPSKGSGSASVVSRCHAAALASARVDSRPTRVPARIGGPGPRRGERHVQGQTAVAVARRHDVPAVRFDDGTIDGQAHAEPLGLARDEGLEDALEL